MEDGEHELRGAVVEWREEDLEGLRGTAVVDGQGDGLGLSLAADFLRGLGELGAADDVDAVAVQSVALQMECLFGLPVGADDEAALVDEHDGVVSVVEDQGHLLGFGLRLLDLGGEVARQLVDGLDECIELIAAVPLQPLVEVAARDLHRVEAQAADGLDLSVREPDGDDERGE